MEKGVWLYNRPYNIMDIEEKPVLDQNRNKIITYDKMFLKKENSRDSFGQLRDRGYQLIGEIGRGGYGVVYKARSIIDVSKIYAIKVNFDNVARSNIYLQVAFFHLVRKKGNLPKIIDFFFVENTPYIVLEYFEHNQFIEIFDQFKTLKDVKHYMLQLFKGLSVLKSIGIYHRDIKPLNFLYHIGKKKGIIIDFGLAEVDADYVKEVVQRRYSQLKSKIPERERNYNSTLLNYKQQFNVYKKLLKANQDHGFSKIGTQSYVSIQTLIHADGQGHQCQVWSAGVIFLQFLTQKLHFFNEPKINAQQFEEVKYIGIFIMQLASMFGSRVVEEHLKKYGWRASFPKNMPEKCILRDMIRLKSNIDQENEHAYDLLLQLVALKPQSRISVEDAIFHPFFDDVRDEHFQTSSELKWLNRQYLKRQPIISNEGQDFYDQLLPKSMSVVQPQSSFSKSVTKQKKEQSSKCVLKENESQSERNYIEQNEEKKRLQKQNYEMEDAYEMKKKYRSQGEQKQISYLYQSSVQEQKKKSDRRSPIKKEEVLVEEKIQIKETINISETIKKFIPRQEEKMKTENKEEREKEDWQKQKRKRNNDDRIIIQTDFVVPKSISEKAAKKDKHISKSSKAEKKKKKKSKKQNKSDDQSYSNKKAKKKIEKRDDRKQLKKEEREDLKKKKEDKKPEKEKELREQKNQYQMDLKLEEMLKQEEQRLKKQLKQLTQQTYKKLTAQKLEQIKKSQFKYEDEES